MLPRGTEIYARHLPFVQDGVELVVSDGKVCACVCVCVGGVCACVAVGGGM